MENSRCLDPIGCFMRQSHLATLNQRPTTQNEHVYACFSALSSLP
jgi:hypothetical protein